MSPSNSGRSRSRSRVGSIIEAAAAFTEIAPISLESRSVDGKSRSRSRYSSIVDSHPIVGSAGRNKNIDPSLMTAGDLVQARLWSAPDQVARIVKDISSNALAWHSMPFAEVVGKLGLPRTHSLPGGLTSQQVVTQRSNYGPNELPKEKRKPFWLIFVSQFRQLLIIILLFMLGLAIYEIQKGGPKIDKVRRRRHARMSVCSRGRRRGMSDAFVAMQKTFGDTFHSVMHSWD